MRMDYTHLFQMMAVAMRFLIDTNLFISAPLFWKNSSEVRSKIKIGSRYYDLSNSPILFSWCNVT